MTSNRMSFVFAVERRYRGGKHDRGDWLSPPPGSYFSSTGTRQTTPLYTTGSKKWDAVAYGGYEGTWEWTFMLDYNYLEPLALAFDTVNDMYVADEIYDNIKDEETYTYTFRKNNCGRVPSFAVRRKILHRVAGGEKDEMVELEGCLVTAISFSRSASTSQYQVQMSGVYANETMTIGKLESTDYEPHAGHLVEYTCVAFGEEGNQSIDELYRPKIVAYTDSVSISIQNNVNTIHSTCSPFAQTYYEGRNHFQISTSCYSINPEHYKTRMYSGGGDPSAREPMTKGLTPLKKMYIFSYDGAYVPKADTELGDYGLGIESAFKESERNLVFTLKDLVIKSMKWTNGDGGKLTDSISSVDCRDLVLIIKSGRPKLFRNTLSSPDPTE